MSKIITIAIILSLASDILGGETFLGYHLRHLHVVNEEPAPVVPKTKENIICFWVSDFNVYALNGLSIKDKDYETKITDVSVVSNFCKNTVTKCNVIDSKSPIIGVQEGKDCIHYAGDISVKENHYKITENLDAEYKPTGVTINYAPGDVCTGDTKHQVTVDFVCESKVDPPEINYAEFSADSCIHKIHVKTKYACTMINFYLISHFLDQYKWAATAIICGLGFFLALFGAKLLKVTMFLICILLVPLLLMVIFLSFTTPSEDWVIWVILGVGIVGGIGLGVLVNQFFQVFAGILGGCLGYVVGLLVANIVLQYISSGATYVYWIIIVASVILFAIVAYFSVKHIMIISTSVIGSYMMIRGASLLLGHFPNESEVLDLIKYKEWSQLNELITPLVYAYIGVFIVLTIAGAALQYCMNKDKSDDDFKYRKIED